MQTNNVDRILENLLQILPVLHKKLLKKDLGDVTGDLTRLHFAIMWMLKDGNMTVSEMAKLAAIAKPQMTHLVDQLVKLDIVERQPDARDRRVINLALTEHGRVLLGEVKQRVMESIRSRLAGLTPEELTRMAEALETLRDVAARL